MPEWCIAVLLGIVEGVTEFLPVSSTGHLILAGHLLGFTGERAATFEICIQLGAILAIVLLYQDVFRNLFNFQSRRGFAGTRGLLLLALTTLPALLAGALVHGVIKRHLFNTTTVAIGLGVGGAAMVWIERALPRPRCYSLGALRWSDALYVGLFQCLALWPGTSRSAATILGGMCLGLERKTAAEYSFLAAVPVLCAAALLDLYKSRHLLQASDLPLFAIGFVVSFLAAWVSVKGFLRLLVSRTLIPFGWYRIALAVVVFAVLYT